MMNRFLYIPFSQQVGNDYDNTLCQILTTGAIGLFKDLMQM